MLPYSALLAFKLIVYFFSRKIAVTVPSVVAFVTLVEASVVLESVMPLDAVHSTNSYPSLGIAVILSVDAVTTPAVVLAGVTVP